jgi:putative ABC transport system permease protein
MSVVADLRYAFRLVRQDWRFSLVLIATLATGIAASGAIFNVVNATLLRPLPVADEARVFRLRDYTDNPGGQRVLRSNRIPNFLSIRDEARAFSSVVGMYRAEWSLIDRGTPIPVNVVLVSPGSLDLLGARVVAGRTFTNDEETTGLDASVIVLSHALWQRQMGGRLDAIGSTVRVEDRVVTVIGVLAPGFRFPYDAEAWMPERFSPAGEMSLAVFARLAPGVSRAQAEAELEAIAARAEAARPVANRGVRFAMTPIREDFVGSQARTTLALMAAAMLLLVLASANVANLLLARGIRRAREVAVRAALGAGRAQQIRQMLIESLVFAALGTVAGLAIAAPLSEAVVDLVPNTLRDQLGLAETHVDWRAALFAAALTAGVGVVAGLAPALRLARADATAALRQSSRAVAGGHRLMRILVAGEVALAAVLLVSAGLMIDNVQRLLHADLGLRAEHLLSVRLPLPPRYDTAERRIGLARQLVDAARALPGTERAGIVSVNPLDRGSFGAAIESEDHPLAPGQSGPIVNHRLATAGWLTTAGVTIVKGRDFDRTDTAGSAPVAIVSRRLADRFWPAIDPIGKRVRQTRAGAPWITIVGVAGDVRDTGEWTETWYLPYDQHAGTLAGGTVHLMLRSSVDPAAALSALRGAVVSIDPLLPVPEPSIMSTMWETAQTPQRMGATASTVFAISGLLLAALGTYGVLAYLVSARAREFGIRQALGATPRRVHALVLRDGAVLVLSGLALGGVLSIAAVRALQTIATEAHGIPTALPWTIAGLLIAAAMTASLVPARRATRMSPVDVMRSE